MRIVSEEVRARRTNISLWLPVGIWMGAVFGFSSMPSLPEIPVIGAVDWGDKISHALMYAIGGALIWRALGNGTSKWRRAALTVLITVAYGFSDEVHQLFVPGRAFDLLDLGADIIGAATSAALLTLKMGGYEIGTGTGRREDLRSERQEAG